MARPERRRAWPGRSDERERGQAREAMGATGAGSRTRGTSPPRGMISSASDPRPRGSISRSYLALPSADTEPRHHRT
jgi:hypothetical protein